MVDSRDSHEYKFFSTIAQAEPKKHAVLRTAESHIIKIDQEIVQRLDITEGDIVSQIVENGILKLIFKTKNKAIGNRHEANNQDHYDGGDE